MRALSGCTRCGHVERTRRGDGDTERRACPDCGFGMKELDLLTARLLIHEKRAAEARRRLARSDAPRGGVPALRRLREPRPVR